MSKSSKWVMGAVLVLALMVSGCHPAKTSKPASSSSSVKLIVVKKHHSAEHPGAAKKAAASKTSSSSGQKSPARKNMQAKAKAMDLAQIQRGDYSSLLGSWQEVARQVNYQNGKGAVWTGAFKNDHLSVTAATVSEGQATLQNDKITANDCKPGKVKFKTQAGSLSANASSGIHNWDFDFYPANTAGKGWPATIDRTKEHITVWHGDDDYLEVYARQAAPAAVAARQKMDLTAIKHADYSSMNGTWRNGKGQTITIKNQQMRFSDFGISQNHAPSAGTVTGLRMNVPSLNTASGKPKQINFHGSKLADYSQQLKLQDQQGFLSIYGEVPMAAYVIGFLPAGKYADKHDGDADRDRIVACQTQSPLENLDADTIYYKVN